MTEIPKRSLETLYDSREIQDIWNYSQNMYTINDPEKGMITPNQYRATRAFKPCPFCGKKMVHGQDTYTTPSQEAAIRLKYYYFDKSGMKKFARIGNLYYHPHYITIDHKINKARCPEKMFDYDNLQAICWRCNQEKGDDNSFEINHTQEYINSLADEALAKYPSL